MAPSYRPNKRKLNEIWNTIETLKHELFVNDCLLKTEVEKRVNSNFDRELMEAELYTQRLAALTEASRSQVWRVQSGALTSCDFYHDYDSWNAKRKRPNYKEELPSCDYSNQYAATTNWYGQAQVCNGQGYSNHYNYNYNQAQQPYRNRKRKNRGPIVSMNRTKINKPAINGTALLPTPKQSVGLLPTPNPAAPAKAVVLTAKTNAATAKAVVSTAKTSAAPAKAVVSTAKTNAATAKAVVSTVKISAAPAKAVVSTAKTSAAPAKAVVSNAKTNASVKQIASNGQTVKQNMPETKPIPTIISAPSPRPILPLRPIKMETWNKIKANESSQNIPSLYSLDMSSIRLQFAPSDRIFIKSENYPSERLLGSNGTVTIKTENPDSMIDDLVDHI